MLSMPEELPLLPAVVENFDIIYDRFIAVTAE